MKVKLLIRENGNPTPRWWTNFVFDHKFHTEQDCRSKLKEYNIDIHVSDPTQHTAWLEFQKEHDRDWFLLKWT